MADITRGLCSNKKDKTLGQDTSPLRTGVKPAVKTEIMLPRLGYIWEDYTVGIQVSKTGLNAMV